jgi:hypothetical protein
VSSRRRVWKTRVTETIRRGRRARKLRTGQHHSARPHLFGPTFKTRKQKKITSARRARWRRWNLRFVCLQDGINLSPAAQPCLEVLHFVQFKTCGGAYRVTAKSAAPTHGSNPILNLVTLISITVTLIYVQASSFLIRRPKLKLYVKKKIFSRFCFWALNRVNKNGSILLDFRLQVSRGLNFQTKSTFTESLKIQIFIYFERLSFLIFPLVWRWIQRK